MSDPLAGTPLRPGPPPTLESRALFRVKAAGVHEPAGPPSVMPDVVLVESADGGVVVYPPSSKLVILAAARKLRAKR